MTTLVVFSSRTGNTKLLAHGICDAYEDAHLVHLVAAASLPEDLSAYDAVLLGFWCDRGKAPEDIEQAAARIRGKRMGCFATIGGDPQAEWARQWMQKTSAELAAKGGNTLEATFMCRGRIDPALFDQMTRMQGGVVPPEREARRAASETHPDRLDVIAAVKAFSGLMA